MRNQESEYRRRAADAWHLASILLEPAARRYWIELASQWEAHAERAADNDDSTNDESTLCAAEPDRQ
jgi:hypothetical protein